MHKLLMARAKLNSARRMANLLLFSLAACGGAVAILFLSVLAMFADTLLPHLIEFCLVAWQSLTVEVAYRLMLLGLLALLLAAFLFLIQLVRNLRSTNRQVRSLLGKRLPFSPRLAMLASSSGISKHIDLVGDERPLAFCYGWCASRILVTTRFVELLDDEELGAALAHEKYHLLNHDPLKILLARALQDSLFFLPILRDLVQNYFAAQEVAADEFVLEMKHARAALANALLKMMDVPILHGLSVGAFSPLGVRIQHLADPSHPFALHLSASRAAISAICAVLLVFAVFHPNTPMLLGHALNADCHGHLFTLDWNALSFLGI